MDFWENLTKAKIIRTEEELKIDVIPIWKYYLLAYLILISAFIVAAIFDDGVSIAIFMFSFMPFLFMYLKLKGVEQSNSKVFFITKNETNGTTSINGEALETFIFTKPYFIDIFVLPLKKGIRVSLENKGLFIGFYTLKNGEDLTTLIDGFTELLDLELYENNKLSDGEVLSFKSKNNAIEPYSGLWIRTPNNKLIISSLPNTSHWLELDLTEQILKNRVKQFALKEIKKMIIKDDFFGNTTLQITTKQGKTKTIFKHKVSEITTIRDKKRLLETLQSQAILQDIEIEIKTA